jgi:hypothetical protein
MKAIAGAKKKKVPPLATSASPSHQSNQTAEQPYNRQVGEDFKNSEPKTLHRQTAKAHK